MIKCKHFGLGNRWDIGCAREKAANVENAFFIHFRCTRE